jgi:hypothetical protein
MLRVVCMYARISHPQRKGTLLWPAAGRTAPQTPAGLSLQGNRRERWGPHGGLQRSVMHDCLAAWRGASHNGQRSQVCKDKQPAMRGPKPSHPAAHLLLRVPAPPQRWTPPL